MFCFLTHKKVIVQLRNLHKRFRHPCISCVYAMANRYHSRFFDCLAHQNLSTTLATDQKWPCSCLPDLRIPYQSLAVPFTIVLISTISTMVNCTLLNFGKIYKDDFKGHFWSVAKVAPRFGCARQSKNLKRYLMAN
jgi:hypothetical protein